MVHELLCEGLPSQTIKMLQLPEDMWPLGAKGDVLNAEVTMTIGNVGRVESHTVGTAGEHTVEHLRVVQ